MLWTILASTVTISFPYDEIKYLLGVSLSLSSFTMRFMVRIPLIFNRREY